MAAVANATATALPVARATTREGILHVLQRLKSDAAASAVTPV